MRRFCLPALLLTLVLLFPSCGRDVPLPAASAVLASMLAAMEDTAQPLPDGITRLTAADPSSPAYLTETFLAALYGPSARGLLEAEENQSPAVSDVALFLSMTAYPCELAVFLCADSDTARAVARMCRSRVDTVARGYGETPWAQEAANGRVTVCGNYVLLALCEDPEATLDSAIRSLP